MKSLKSLRYNYNPTQPLSKQYKDTEVFNAYYKCFDTHTQMHFLLSHFQTNNVTQLTAFFKKFSKIKETLANVQNRYLSKIHDVFEEDNSLYLVLDYSEAGSLIDYVGKSATVDSKIALRVISGVMSGLAEMHRHELLHSFINLQNIEIDSQGLPRLTFKCIIYKSLYLAPEFKKKHQKSKESDIFALGICLYRLLYGLFPFKQKNVEQFYASIKAGPPYLTVAQQQQKQGESKKNMPFPLIPLNDGVKSILTHSLHVIPEERNKSINKMLNFLGEQTSETSLNSEIFGKVFKNRYVNLLTRLETSDEQEFKVLDVSEKKLLCINVYRSEEHMIQSYMRNVIGPFTKVQSESLVKVYEYRIIQGSYLVIVSSYCQQGKISEYPHPKMKKSEKYYDTFFDPEAIQYTINSLLSCIRNLPQPYRYLDEDSVLIKGCKPKLKFPKFPTKQFELQLKKSMGENGFIAPEVRVGEEVSDKKCDTWSIAVLEFWMTFGELPQFDQNDCLLINNRDLISREKVIYFCTHIEKSPKIRKNVFDSQLSGLQMRSRSDAPSKKGSGVRVKTMNSKIDSQSLISNIPTEISNKKKLNNRFELPKVQEEKHPNSNIINRPILEAATEKNTVKQVFTYLVYSMNDLDRCWHKPIRLLIKILVVILLYLFVFYFEFFKNDGYLLGERMSYQETVVMVRAFSTDTTPTISYELVTKTPSQTNSTFYNSTLSVVRDQYACVLNDYSVGSNVVFFLTSGAFSAYGVFGFLFAIINILLACMFIARMDFAKVSSCNLSYLQVNRYYAFYNWGISLLILSTLTSLHYLIYGGLYHIMMEPCLGKTPLPGLEFLMKAWLPSWVWRFIWIYLGITLTYGLSIYILLNPAKKHHMYFYYAIIPLYLLGVGVRGMGKFVTGQHQSVFGVCGELLVLIVGLCMLLIDIFFIKLVTGGKSSTNVINLNQFHENHANSKMRPGVNHKTDESNVDMISINDSIEEENNRTEEYLFEKPQGRRAPGKGPQANHRSGARRDRFSSDKIALM